jgi:hypothetical protein
MQACEKNISKAISPSTLSIMWDEIQEKLANVRCGPVQGENG